MDAYYSRCWSIVDRQCGDVQTGYEAWIDSGVDFSQLKGSDKVGVYVGACSSDAHSMWLDDIPSISGSRPKLESASVVCLHAS